MSVRQYKIHTNLDGENNIIFDVTNGKLRFYAPTNLGITITNNIWSANGIGVKGNSNINQPNITFGVETFGESLKENYDLLTNFIQTVMSVNFVTLEYTTESFTVYADIALSEQTKTEGYGKNGTFSETITFEPITKWYTFEKLSFSTVENGEFNKSYSKIYGTNVPDSKKPVNLLRGTGTSVSSTGTNTSNQRTTIYLFDNGKTFAEQGFNVGDKLAISFDYSISNPASGSFSIQFNDTPWTISGANKNIDSSTTTGHIYISFDITSSNISGAATGVELRLDNVPTTTTVTISKMTIKVSSNELTWSGSTSEVGGYVYSSKPSYTYFGEDNISRFSRWNIDAGIFSFTATMTPLVTSNMNFGLSFLDENFNEYTAIILKMSSIPQTIQFNTDVNDEYYNAVISDNVINQFPALDFGRFRTRVFEKGTMALINVKDVEISIKKKVDFI